MAKYRLGELFCGPGGIACGASLADIGDKNYLIVHAWANDYDQDTCCLLYTSDAADEL